MSLIKHTSCSLYLNEEVDHGGGGAVDDLRLLGDDTTREALVVLRHLVDAEPHRALGANVYRTSRNKWVSGSVPLSRLQFQAITS